MACWLTVPSLRTWSRSQGPHSDETWTQYVVQPTECRGRDLIVMKLNLDLSCHLLDAYTRFQVHISKHVEKKVRKLSSGGELCWVPLSECLWPPRGQTLPTHYENQYSSRHLLCKWMYQIWKRYIMFKAINKEKLLWSIFGCKVGQSVPILTFSYRKF